MSTIYDDEIVVSRTEMKRLMKRDAVLTALEAWGVDNWIGYDDALAQLNEDCKDDEDDEDDL